ncbi:hypothetical protein HYDPIDRAFT_112992 [Hydnomerulius pinastri MD-312]|uniref:C3H1-type domain-containing protein n=1 Tax=Hydnomerulius pinastri MD-312 TaxID=994086 RepID=A0A0C9VDB6_9AGAM|nr:hypothetical protein HYDPIDRAFT_112992 [Hydnomerulius pinastri MD-312]
MSDLGESDNTCRQFAKTGTCRFGNECRYQHDYVEMSVSSSAAKDKGKGKKAAKKTGARDFESFSETTPLRAFFAKYPSFAYDTSNSSSKEYYRLCEELHWDREDVDRFLAYEEFKNALVKQFNMIYGTDESSLHAWRNICEAINISPVPEGLNACRQAVRDSHVNLVDLIDSKVNGGAVERFSSEIALGEYTKRTGKYFPYGNAHAGGLLRSLLRRADNPSGRSKQKHRRK